MKKQLVKIFRKKVPYYFQGIILVGWVLNFGCSLKKDDPHLNPSLPSGSLESFQINQEDWNSVEKNYPGAQVVQKSVKPEKLDYIRKNFRAPRLSSVSVPESNGFDLFEAKGYQELENGIYIQPKVFIHTGSSQGSILGYKTGEKDRAGNEVIEISIPIALVDGLVSSLSRLGSNYSGTSAAIALPPQYQIPNAEALKSRLGGKELRSLQACPSLFELTLNGKSYIARSPYDGNTLCPMNQFFRIQFRAPIHEMEQILETAAIRDDAVQLITHLTAAFEAPRAITEVSFEPYLIEEKLISKLNQLSLAGRNSENQKGYLTQDIEEAILDSIFSICSDQLGVVPELSESVLLSVKRLMAEFFDDPFPCGASHECRSLSVKKKPRKTIHLSWMVTEPSAPSLETKTITSLGAVANSSEFVSKPKKDLLDQLERPAYFQKKRLSEVIRECAELAENKFDFNPGITDEEKTYFEGYCRSMVSIYAHNEDDPEQLDGYFPLGQNTVVYPGAWLRLDFDQIHELTTAKTRVMPDGRVDIESEVVDLIANDPQAKRTQCVEGQALACVKYRENQVPVRDEHGNQLFLEIPCKKGEAGCNCVNKTSPEGVVEEVCMKKDLVFHSETAFTCDPKEEYSYCPYWRLDSEQRVAKIDYDCQEVKVEDKSSFLCLFGCGSHTETRCVEKGREYKEVLVQKLNCSEDDPVGIAPRVRACRAPKYLCEKWNSNCTKYSVNEVFHIVHEDIAPHWRPFAVQKGEYPQKFLENIYLKFVSPHKTVKGCRLSEFKRYFAGGSIYIKIPSDRNDDPIRCENNEPIWNDQNTDPLSLPVVYMKNEISYPEARLCGKTEYSFTTKEVPVQSSDGLVPPEFAFKTEAKIGPVPGTCHHHNTQRIGSDLWFTEYPPIKIQGRVSVLGRILESVVTENK